MKEDWNLLLRKSLTGEVFLSWEWICSWWDVFKDENKSLYILIGRNENNEIVGIAPFYIERRKILGLGFRKIIRFCSSLETYPDHLDLICKKGYEDSFAKGVFDYLKKDAKEWDLIKLNGVGENRILIKSLNQEKIKLNGFLADLSAESECPYLSVEGTYEDYLKSFPRKKRYNLSREKKILLQNERAVWKTAAGEDEYEEYFRNLFQLHAERAERKGISTTFSGDRIYDFHKSVIHYLASKGQIVLSLITKNSTILASCYCLKDHNKYYYYQTGISAEGEKWSAGSVLLSLMIEKAFNEGCREFDFLRGNEEYKHFWTQQYRSNCSIEVRKNNLGGNISLGADRLFRSLKIVKKLIKK
jgi:CelD/BcsL family acetyltransferase involved in cellulose biosynthesis